MVGCPIVDRQMFYMSAIVTTCLAEFEGILTLQWGGPQSGRPFRFPGLLNPGKTGTWQALRTGAGDALKDVDGDSYAGMDDVAHVVATIVVNDVNVIRVKPTYWPRVNEPERIAAPAEAVMVEFALVNMEVVPAAKTGAVVGVRNTAMIATAGVSTVTL